MPGQAPPLPDERELLLAFLNQQRDGLRYAAFGLTDLSSAAPQQEITGTYAMWHRDDFAHGRALHEFMLDTGKQLVKVDLDDSRVLGKKLRLRGNLTYENGVTAFETTSAEPVAAAATTSVTPGVSKPPAMI
jgi:hypothetical protein